MMQDRPDERHQARGRRKQARFQWEKARLTGSVEPLPAGETAAGDISFLRMYSWSTAIVDADRCQASDLHPSD
jgi:hypothetical protein